MDNNDAFLVLAHLGDLQRVQKMLADGDAHIGEADQHGSTAVIYATWGANSLPTLIWLLEESGAAITDRDSYGYSALLQAAACGRMKRCR
jgi:ankyrin repeat protein